MSSVPQLPERRTAAPAFPMYPDLPKSPADLVPLPQCDGPKLKPFDFHGPKKIEFLEHIGEGLHSHVFKVVILGEVYALKLFKFLDDREWSRMSSESYSEYDLEAVCAVANYSEPFYCECRAFGRLQEAGFEDLATRCFGYVLLDEAHEAAVRSVAGDDDLSFGSEYMDNEEYNRQRFPGETGRPSPIRGIVKEFGQLYEDPQARDFRAMLQSAVAVQQLGIVNLDLINCGQFVNGKLADFSMAITPPPIPATRPSPDLRRGSTSTIVETHH